MTKLNKFIKKSLLDSFKRMNMKKILVLLSLIVIITVGIIIIIVGNKPENYVEIDGEKIIVELARTDNERQEGLMHRDKLCDDCGMLFIFNEESRHDFWMKNTKIPLDMIFIDSDLKIVDILYAEPCAEDPCKSYVSNKNALYILETNGNKFNEDIIGQKIDMVLK